MTPLQPGREPDAPILFDITVKCQSCQVSIRVASRKSRPAYKFTCPRCSTVNDIVLSLPAEPPPPVAAPPVVYQLAIAPPLPVAKPSPPIAYSVSRPMPVDLFAQALASNSPSRTISNEPPELPTIRTLARFGLMIAKADGQVANAERIAVREFLTRLFGHNSILVRHIDPIMEAAEKAIPTEAAAIADVVRCTPPDKRHTVFLAAEKIADACGTRNQFEIDTLQRVAIAFGMIPPTAKIEPAPEFANIFNVPTRPKPEAVRVAEAPSQSITPIELPELHAIQTLARFGLMIAKADGFIGDPERSAVRLFLTTLFGQNPMLAQRIDTTLHAVERAVPKEAVAIAEVIACTSPERRRDIYLAAEKIAAAWLPRNKSEVETLKRVAIAFDVVPVAPRVEMTRPVSSIFTVPTPPIPEAVRRVAEAPSPQRVSPPKPMFAVGDPRKLLEIEPNMKLSVELIRRRFALLSEKINPKKAAAFGPEFVALAMKNLAELRAAAESLIAPFGVSLDAPTAPPQPTDMRHNPDLDDVFG